MAAAAPRRLTRPKTIALAIALATAAALVLAFQFMSGSAPPDIARAFPSGEIVIGLDASFPPFALDDGQSIQGLDIDLARAIAAELNLPARFVNIGFYALHDALISAQVDVLVSALRVDPARTQDLRYTQSYFDNGLVIVSSPGAAKVDVTSLAKPRIAYEYASSAESQIRAWEAERPSIQPLPYELPEYALDALRLGLADGAVVDATTLRLYLRARSDWQPPYEYITHELYAIAIRIDRADAWQLVDEALGALKVSGELAKIIDKWL